MKQTVWRPKWARWALANGGFYQKGDTWLWFELDNGGYAQVWHCWDWPRKSWAITIFRSDGTSVLQRERKPSKRKALRYLRQWEKANVL